METLQAYRIDLQTTNIAISLNLLSLKEQMFRTKAKPNLFICLILLAPLIGLFCFAFRSLFRMIQILDFDMVSELLSFQNRYICTDKLSPSVLNLFLVPRIYSDFMSYSFSFCLCLYVYTVLSHAYNCVTNTTMKTPSCYSFKATSTPSSPIPNIC
jgi:hypothetical protein